MGLDMYVGDKHVWSSRYSTFNDWRDYLYSLSGYVNIEQLEIRKRNGYGYWDDIPLEPMLVLMIHHDDTGYIYPKEANALKERIRELEPHISKEWHRHTKQFLKALSLCIKTGQRIEFQ